MKWRRKGRCRRLKKENIPIIPTTLRAASADTILADQQSQGDFMRDREEDAHIHIYIYIEREREIRGGPS